MKLREIQESANALRGLSGTPLPAKAAYRVGKAIGVVQSALRTHNKAHEALVRKYGERDGNGMTTVTPENMEAFRLEVEELLDKDVDLSALHRLPVSMFEDHMVEPGILAQLDGWFIYGDEDGTQ